MLKLTRTIRSLGAVLLLVTLSGQALALPVLNNGRQRIEAPRLNNSPSQRIMSADEAINIAERRYQGRAVGAQHLGNGVYRVRVLQNNGKVKTVIIDNDGLRR